MMDGIIGETSNFTATLNMTRPIMIIEDDVDTLEIMSYILGEEGYQVISGSNVKVLAEVHAHQPLLILMDNRLTEGLGRDFCKRFKDDPTTSHFPVVLVSANPGLETMAQESNADGYLKKPFDIDELLQIVKFWSK